MKKFFGSILCVSIFFLGLGGLIREAGAKFKSDPKALELLAKARQALGGDEALRSVRSLSIKGKTTLNPDANGASRSIEADLEMALQLPNQFTKMIRAGSPDGKGASVTEERMVSVVVAGDQPAGTLAIPGHPGQAKVIIKKEGGAGEEVRVDGNKVVRVESAGGDTKEITTPDGKKIIVKSIGDGSAIWHSSEGGAANPDGKHAIFMKDIEGHTGAPHANEVLRITLALLLSAPEGIDVAYTSGGEGNVDGVSCNILEAGFAGQSYKIFLDKSSNLPVAMNYRGMKMQPMPAISKEEAKDGKVIIKRIGAPDMADFQVKFSDYRGVSGIQFPHKWITSSNGAISESFEAASFEVNPADIADKFKGQKVMVRMKKAN